MFKGMSKSKRRSRQASSEERASKRRPMQQLKQHLYLLLDDWERGYSIHRLDVDDLVVYDGDADGELLPKHITEPPPPVARVEAPHVRSWNFVSHGSKIFSMKAKEASPAIPAFDTHTLGLTICPWPSCRADYASPSSSPSVASSSCFWRTSRSTFGDPPPYDSEAPWSWTTVKAPLPFYNAQVACYALHPDNHTLFVSAGSGTFSFDAERLEWTRCGDWLLPFHGQAYFDAQLEAWVGLCGERDRAGHLCCCDVLTVGAAESTRPPPSWKLCKDQLFHMESELHRGAKLVYMGDRKFCLVESTFHKYDQRLHRDPKTADFDVRYSRRRRCVLHMTTFRLTYNKAGELQIMLRQSHTAMTFERPHDLTERSLEPLAFWI